MTRPVRGVRDTCSNYGSDNLPPFLLVEPIRRCLLMHHLLQAADCALPLQSESQLFPITASENQQSDRIIDQLIHQMRYPGQRRIVVRLHGFHLLSFQFSGISAEEELALPHSICKSRNRTRQ